MYGNTTPATTLQEMNLLNVGYSEGIRIIND